MGVQIPRQWAGNRVSGPSADFVAHVNRTVTLSTILFFRTHHNQMACRSVFSNGNGIMEMVLAETLTGAPFQHTYTQSGVFPVQLTVVDNQGCSDSRTRQHAVTISRPSAKFESPDSLSCTGKPYGFVNQTTGIIRYILVFWRWAKYSCRAACPYLYTEGDYTVKLVAQ